MSKKNWKGDPSVSPGIVCYAEKEKPSWFSSLGQMIQSFKNYIGQFVWIEKKSQQ